MTIKDIVFTINADPDLYITIWDRYKRHLLYCGRFYSTTERMCNWKVWDFEVLDLEVKDNGTKVTKMVFTLEYQEEKF